MRSVLYLLVAASCVDSSLPTDVPDDDSVLEEGDIGHIRVQTPTGFENLTYEVRDGRAIVEGDIDIGAVKELHRLRGGAARLGELWPGGAVWWGFDEDFVGQTCDQDSNGDPINCVDSRDRVRDALKAMEQRLPLSFHESEPPTGTVTPFIRVKWGPPDVNKSSASHIGMAWDGQTLTFQSGHDGIAGTFNAGPPVWIIEHEMLHSIGLWHEQSRTDRDAFITVNFDCVADDHQYEMHSDSADLGPYDFKSIMHYSNGQFCEKDAVTNHCICDTMTPVVAGTSLGARKISREDVNTVYRMYAEKMAGTQPDALYGAAIAIGDFDADGYDDMAIGAPGDKWVDTSFNSFPAAGSVLLYRGTSVGPVLWNIYAEVDWSGTFTANGRFGTALAAGDYNADGVMDLAVGEPGAAGGAGGVLVYLGSKTQGLLPHRFLTQTTTIGTDEAGDRFGAALAAGPLTGLKRTDTCDVTAKGERHWALAVGAPGDRNPSRAGGTVRSGAVYVYQDFIDAVSCSTLLAAPTRLANASGSNGDDFGAALATGDLDGDGKADLAVGMPHKTADTGGVVVYPGRLPSGPPILWGAMVGTGVSLAGTKDTQFGAALAIGDIATTAGQELAVGAPGKFGRVVVFSAALTAPSAVAFLVDDAPVLGDRFGAALAIGDVDRTDTARDLVIGIPGKDKSGAITIVRGGVPGLTIRKNYRQSDLGGSNSLNDGFGSALAIGQLNDEGDLPSTADHFARRADLAIGAPGKNTGAGWNYVVTSDWSALPIPWKMMDESYVK